MSEESAAFEKFQVSEEFPPDKESTWNYPMEKDGWLLAHSSIAGEIDDMKSALSAVSKRGGELESWECNCIRNWWEGHLRHVHAHHNNEDKSFIPYLKSRFQIPDKLEADHKDLIDLSDKIESMIESLVQGSSVDELQMFWEKYENMMKAHLKEEEDSVVPMMRAFFTPGEIGPLVGKVIALGPIEEMGSFIYYLGKEKFQKEFMVQEGIPPQVWDIEFNGKYTYYQKNMVAQIDALKSGSAPWQAPKFFCCETKFLQ